MDAWLTGTYQRERLLVEAGGRWTLSALVELDECRRRLLAAAPAVGGAASIDLRAVQRLDTAGAWLLDKLTRELAERGWQVEWTGARDAHAGLLAEIRRIGAEPLPPAPDVNPMTRMLAHLGRSTSPPRRSAAAPVLLWPDPGGAGAPGAVWPSRLRLTR
jgi:phospholipid/cholesterol/gamma-HCH transport system permease protein